MQAGEHAVPSFSPYLGLGVALHPRASSIGGHKHYILALLSERPVYQLPWLQLLSGTAPECTTSGTYWHAAKPFVLLVSSSLHDSITVCPRQHAQQSTVRCPTGCAMIRYTGSFTVLQHHHHTRCHRSCTHYIASRASQLPSFV